MTNDRPRPSPRFPALSPVGPQRKCRRCTAGAPIPPSTPKQTKRNETPHPRVRPSTPVPRAAPRGAHALPNWATQQSVAVTAPCDSQLARVCVPPSASPLIPALPTDLARPARVDKVHVRLHLHLLGVPGPRPLRVVSRKPRTRRAHSAHLHRIPPRVCQPVKLRPRPLGRRHADMLTTPGMHEATVSLSLSCGRCRGSLRGWEGWVAKRKEARSGSIDTKRLATSRTRD